jgi:EEF1A lysine methyltransferase 1
VRYDFNAPLDLPAELKGAFDMVVIDPPFITHEVWRQYARTARALLGADPEAAGPLPDGKRVIGTTIAENTDLLAAELGLRRAVFRPSIPHLVYQYEVFVNFDPVHLAVPNPEIPADD